MRVGDIVCIQRSAGGQTVGRRYPPTEKSMSDVSITHVKATAYIGTDCDPIRSVKKNK